MKKVLVLLDLDGVVANDRHRQHFGQEGKWNEYYNLMNNDEVWEKGRELYDQNINKPNTKVGFLTARYENKREVTIEWLDKKRFSTKIPLIMRPLHSDKSVKEFKAIAVKAMLQIYDEVILYDDDPIVVNHIKTTVGEDNAVLCEWDIKPQALIDHGEVNDG